MSAKSGLYFMFLLHLLFRKTCYGQGCDLDLINQAPKGRSHKPLIFYDNETHFELAVTKNGIVRLNRGETVILACPGPGNKFAAIPDYSLDYALAICRGSNQLEINSKLYKYDVLQCLKSIRGSVRETGRMCATNEGSIFEIGYQISLPRWYTLITVCYHDTSGITFFSRHILHGQEIKYSASSEPIPFSTQGSGSVPMTLAYNKTFQKSNLGRLLKSQRLADFYITSTSYLAKGHLAPNADFLTTVTKRTTYFYINACPQWQAINNGNWKSVELSVRKKAEQCNCDMEVVTGTYGVMSLKNDHSVPVPFYMAPRNELPVPELIWKIVIDQQSRKGIAFVVVNNPFAAANEIRVVCTDICSRYGWGNSKWKNINGGYVYCCDVNDLKRVVGNAPDLDVRGILTGPQTVEKFFLVYV